MKNLYTFLLLSFFNGLVSAQIINSFPHVEDFENFGTCGINCGSTCNLINGWYNDPFAQLDWLVDINGTTSSNTGPTANGGADHNPGIAGGKYLYTESSNACFPSKTHFLVTPQIDFSQINFPQMSFWYHMFGNTMGAMHVDIDTTGTGNNWINDIVPSWTSNQDIWQQKIIDLSSYTGDTVRIRIRGITGSNFFSDMAVDDFTFYQLLAEDAGVKAFVTPQSPACGVNDSVYIALNNFGVNDLDSVMIHWSINNSVQPTYQWYGSLDKDSCENVFLGTGIINIDDTIVAWTSLPNGIIELPSGINNDTSSIIIEAGLSGQYSIGSGGDYPTFTDAVDALNQYGICDPVIFSVSTGGYSEQLTLLEVPNASLANTITFQSSAGHKDSVSLHYSSSQSSQNYTVKFEGADYYKFKDLTIEGLSSSYGRVLDYSLGASSNQIINCNIRGDLTPAFTSTNIAVIYSDVSADLDNGNIFRSNTIEGGSYGIYWNGGSATSLESGTIIENNLFLNQYRYGSYLAFQDAPQFINNKFETNTQYFGSVWGGYFSYCDNGLKINNNEIYSNKYGYGIYLNNCDASSIQKGQFYNNMIHVGSPLNSNTSYGIYITNSSYQQIVHNNISIESNGGFSRAFYTTGGAYITLLNNNLVNNGPGYAIYVQSNFSLDQCNYNNLYAKNGKIGYFGGIDQISLLDWQNNTSYDANSVSIDPLYRSVNDLHICNDTLLEMGTSYPLLVQDFDGQTHTNPPVIGADEFSFLTIPPFSLGQDTGLCLGDSLTLDPGVSGYNYSWSTGDTSQMITVRSTATYSITVSDENGCFSASDDLSLVVDTAIIVDLGPDDTTCGNSRLDAGIVYADSYLWSTGATTQTIDVATSGSYSVNVSKCGIVGTDIVSITVDDLPIIDLGSDTSYCAGDSIILLATQPNVSYLWSTGDTQDSIVVNSSGTYSVTLTDNSTGCTNFDSIKVTDLTNLNIDLGPDTYICDTGTIDAGIPGLSYQWSTGATSQAINVWSGNTYWVIASKCGLSDTDSVVVNISPGAVDLGADTILCDGTAIRINAGNSGSIFDWNNGQTSQQIIVNVPGNYHVDIVDTNGCIANDTILVSTISNPNYPNLGDYLTSCGDTTLDAGNTGATFLWSTGATTQSIWINSSGNYNVEVTNGGYCPVNDTVFISILTTPVIDLGPDTFICSGDDYILDPGPGYAYLWSDLSINQTLSVSSAGQYNVIATDLINGCVNRDTITIGLNNLPTVNLGMDMTICDTIVPYILDAGIGFNSYLWSDNSTAQTLPISSSGNYSVTVTDSNNCENASSVLVIVNDCSGTTGIKANDPVGKANWYPNPTNGVVTIELEGIQDKVILSILDLTGKIVHKELLVSTNRGDHIKIDLSYLAKGTYCVMLENETFRTTGKLSVQ